MRAIDISHHTGEITSQQARALRDEHNVTRVVVGLQNTTIARQQMQVLTDAGLELHAYVYLYFGRNVIQQTAQPLAKVTEFPIERVWLDAEDMTSGMKPFRIAAQLLLAEREVNRAGRKPGIYTRRSWWNHYMKEMPTFNHLPLWAAWWNGRADYEGFRFFGGWTELAMKQYAADSMELGVRADLNVYEPAAVPHEHAGLLTGLDEIQRIAAGLRAQVAA